MTVQKAIKYWKVFLKEIALLKREHSYVDWDEQEQATKMAIEALEKQIPKKAVAGARYKCPSCGEMFVSNWKFCFECGQKLDWGD